MNRDKINIQTHAMILGKYIVKMGIYAKCIHKDLLNFSLKPKKLHITPKLFAYLKQK